MKRKCCYRNYDGKIVKVFTDQGEVYFCVRDIIKILGVTNYSKILNRVEDINKKQIPITAPEGKKPQVYWFVNRYGLMSIVFRATKTNGVSPTSIMKWAEEIERHA